MDPVTDLYACPSCDCLFVALASTAACPLCKTRSTHSGREWLARRAARRMEEVDARAPEVPTPRPALPTPLPAAALAPLETFAEP